MSALSDHLLRTLAAIPPRSRVLDVRGTHAHALVRLGFDAHVCAPDEEAARSAGEALVRVTGAQAGRRRVAVQDFPRLAYPDAHFDWVVAVRPFHMVDSGERVALLQEARRVMKPGGWMYVAVPAAASAERNGAESGFTEAALGALMAAADWAEAQAPRRIESEGVALVQAIYRRVEEDTPL